MSSMFKVPYPRVCDCEEAGKRCDRCGEKIWLHISMQLALKMRRNVTWLAMGHHRFLNIHAGFTLAPELIAAESCIFICLSPCDSSSHRNASQIPLIWGKTRRSSSNFITSPAWFLFMIMPPPSLCFASYHIPFYQLRCQQNVNIYKKTTVHEINMCYLENLLLLNVKYHIPHVKFAHKYPHMTSAIGAVMLIWKIETQDSVAAGCHI